MDEWTYMYKRSLGRTRAQPHVAVEMRRVRPCGHVDAESSRFWIIKRYSIKYSIPVQARTASCTGPVLVDAPVNDYKKGVELSLAAGSAGSRKRYSRS